MKVTLDLGNTTLSICSEQKKPYSLSWLETQHKLPTLFSKNDEILFCSVNQEKEPLIRKYYPQAKKVGDDIPYPLKLLVTNTVGADRILASYGGFLQQHLPTITIDCGTAITIDFVNQAKEFVGGLIFPGPRLLSESLHQECSQLPKVFPICPSSSFLGKTTEEAITVGITQGIQGLIERVIQGIKKEFALTTFSLYATGGAAQPFLAPLHIPIIPDLIHQGLRELF